MFLVYMVEKNNERLGFLDSYTNAQHSNVLMTKSSSGANGSLEYVLHDCDLPLFKSPSSHNPNLPLKIK